MAAARAFSAPIRWGICGVGSISNDFCLALNYNKSKIQACAARDLSRAETFAKDFGITKAYGSYKEMAEDEEVDVVYVGTVHPAHFELASLFMTAGKAVLCEKPMAMNEAQVQGLIDLAKEKDVFFMEGMWTRAFPVARKIREILDSGRLGAPHAVTSDFGFVGPENKDDWLWKPETGGGALMGIGCYNVAWASFALGTEMPEVKAVGKVNESGVDTRASIGLSYPTGVASLTYGLDANYPEETRIMCEKGFVAVEQWAHTPTKAKVVVCETRMDQKTEILEEALPVFDAKACGGRKVVYPNSEGFVYQAQEVEDCLLKGLKESPVFPLQESLTNCKIMDEVRRQLGVVYEADRQAGCTAM